MSISTNHIDHTSTSLTTDPRRGHPPVRRTASRLIAASLIAVVGAAATATAAGAAPGPGGPEGDSIEGQIEAYDPPTAPKPSVPHPTVPSVGDLQLKDDLEVHLPDGYTYPDDDADPEPCGEDCPPAADDDLLEEAVPLDPEVGPQDCTEDHPCEEPGDEPSDDCDDPEPTKPEKPTAEVADDQVLIEKAVPEFPGGDVPEATEPEDCDTPEDTPTTTPETPTTTPEVEYEVDERKVEELAFTGSNLLLPLVGAGILGAGAVAVGLSLAARRRTEAQEL